MTGRVLFILFSIFIAGGFLLNYFFDELSPINQDVLERIVIQEEIEIGDEGILYNVIEELIASGRWPIIVNSNIYTVLTIIFISLSCFFIAVHISVDKLFFKKFYETPNYHQAIRRGIIITLFTLSVITWRLLSLSWISISIFGIALLLFEIAINQLIQIRPTQGEELEELSRDKTKNN